MRRKSDRVVVLRVRPFRDFDAIATVFGEKIGKKNLFVAGLRRPKSKKSGLFLPFSVLKIDFSVAENLPRLFSAELFSPPPKMRAELFSLIEMAEKFSRENAINFAFFSLFSAVFRARDFSKIPPIFLLKTLSDFGFLSDFRFCGKCGEKFSDFGFFDGGAIFCQKCRRVGEKFSFSEIKILHFWQKNPLFVAEKVSFSKDFGRRIFAVFSQFSAEMGVALKISPF